MFNINKQIFQGKIQKNREYKHPFMRSMHGQKLCVNFKMVDQDHYKTEEFWRPLNEGTLMSMGYMPAEGYKTQLKYATTDVYVKFQGFDMHPCVRMNADGDMCVVDSLETASTLYDYFVSHAEEQFMDGMKAKKSTALSKNTIIIGIVLLAALVIGGYLIAH